MFWSQHPLRQRRELSLHIDDEFAFNARISPLSAVWANTMFDASLKKLKARRKECQRLIGLLNQSGLTERIDFYRKGIEPAFYLLAAHWKDGPREAALERFLASYNVKATVEPLPVRPLYREP